MNDIKNTDKNCYNEIRYTTVTKSQMAVIAPALLYPATTYVVVICENNAHAVITRISNN